MLLNSGGGIVAQRPRDCRTSEERKYSDTHTHTRQHFPAATPPPSFSHFSCFFFFCLRCAAAGSVCYAPDIPIDTYPALVYSPPLFNSKLAAPITRRGLLQSDGATINLLRISIILSEAEVARTPVGVEKKERRRIGKKKRIESLAKICRPPPYLMFLAQ